MTDSLRTVDFLRNLADYLRQGAPYFRPEIEQTLTGLLDNFTAVRTEYGANVAPPGTEAVRDLMLETLDLSEASIREFLQFLEDGVADHLTVGVAQAEEADDVLAAIEDLVGQSKEWLNECNTG